MFASMHKTHLEKLGFGGNFNLSAIQKEGLLKIKWVIYLYRLTRPFKKYAGFTVFPVIASGGIQNLVILSTGRVRF
jgi:hypothetical protein